MRRPPEYRIFEWEGTTAPDRRGSFPNIFGKENGRMKFMHLSDLHLGKRVHEFSMAEDQQFIMEQILSVVDAEKPDALLIAGDVYDKPLPPVEAIEIFDRFLVELSERRVPVFIISGNHDSSQRLAFGAKLMEGEGIHIAPVYDGTVEPITLTDAFGNVNIYMLPFEKPAAVRRFFAEQEILSYTDAVKAAIVQMNPDTRERNILITHHFVAGALSSESEEISVGGTEQVDAAVFAPFDYTALGHLHSPQNCGTERIRYSGTPLKYSFSEESDSKSVTVAELREKGTLEIRALPLLPLRDLRTVRGTYDELMQQSFTLKEKQKNDYLRVVLTDEEDIPDAAARLRTVYPNLMKLEYDNSRTRAGILVTEFEETQNISPLAWFSALYEQQNGRKMSAEQEAFIKNLMKNVWEDPECDR